MCPSPDTQILHGVRIVPLDAHPDQRGTFSEIFRDEWNPEVRPVQWNVVHSAGGVLRGVHLHRRHSDYLTVIAGSMLLGLCDLRRSSPTFRLAVAIEVTPARAILIPPGVAHGFYFPETAIHIYGVDRYWDPEDELGCHWSDPELRIPWDVRNPILSPRDAGLPPLSGLLEQVA